METNPYQKIVEALVKKSRAKELLWVSTDAENEFVLGFTHYSLSLRVQQEPPKNRTVAILSIFENKTGKKLDSVLFNQREHLGKALMEIFETARGQVFHLDDAVDEILGHLGKQGVVGRKRPRP